MSNVKYRHEVKGVKASARTKPERHFCAKKYMCKRDEEQQPERDELSDDCQSKRGKRGRNIREEKYRAREEDGVQVFLFL